MEDVGCSDTTCRYLNRLLHSPAEDVTDVHVMHMSLSNSHYVYRWHAAPNLIKERSRTRRAIRLGFVGHGSICSAAIGYSSTQATYQAFRYTTCFFIGP